MRETFRPIARNLSSLGAARYFFEECLSSGDPARETLWVAHVEAKGRCLHLANYDGNDSSAPCPTENILADVLENGTHGIFLAHNHPRGLHYPSRHDLLVTQQLATQTQAFRCAVLDHLIFAGTECTSFQQLGLECWLQPGPFCLRPAASERLS